MERSRVDDGAIDPSGVRTILAWERETVMSFRKMALAGSRPTEVSGAVISKVLPVWGPLIMEITGLTILVLFMRSGAVASSMGMRKTRVESVPSPAMETPITYGSGIVSGLIHRKGTFILP